MEFIYVRSQSDDRSIWTSVVDDDEYRIDALQETDIVLDIGMHTGSFVHRAWLAGSRRLFGFEVDTENFLLAHANVGTRAQVLNQAVVRSDKREHDLVYYTGHIPMEHELNTGVGTVFGQAGTPVPTIALDTILATLGHVRLMKIDTEGSEWPILYTSTHLNTVTEIVGEWHLNHPDLEERFGLPPCNLPALANFLGSQGFIARFYAREEDMPNPVVGYFRAVRNPTEGPWRMGEGRRLLCASDF